MSDITNKQRLIKMLEIFDKETDENHELSVKDIINKLKREFGDSYKVNERSIKNDIKIIDQNRYTLIDNPDKYGRRVYSKQDRKFEAYELRMLIDAVNSSKFILTKDKKKLIEELKSLTSNYIAGQLQNHLFMIETNISIDPNLKYNIYNLHTALQDNKKIKFQYGRFNVNKDFVLSHDGDYYDVEPYGLVWNSGFYYLVGKNLNKNEIVNYRVDRMRNVNLGQVFNKSFFDLAEHVSKCFNMYPGDVKQIKIKFHKHLINAIIDRFGLDEDIKPLDHEYFLLTTTAAINKGLIRWILIWGSDAEVLYPELVREEIREEIKKMNKIYEL